MLIKKVKGNGFGGPENNKNKIIQRAHLFLTVFIHTVRLKPGYLGTDLYLICTVVQMCTVTNSCVLPAHSHYK